MPPTTFSRETAWLCLEQDLEMQFSCWGLTNTLKKPHLNKYPVFMYHCVYAQKTCWHSAAVFPKRPFFKLKFASLVSDSKLHWDGVEETPSKCTATSKLTARWFQQQNRSSRESMGGSTMYRQVNNFPKLRKSGFVLAKVWGCKITVSVHLL